MAEKMPRASTSKRQSDRPGRDIADNAPHEAAEILWLAEFLPYRIPALAAQMLRETSRACRAQEPPVTTAQWRIMSILANFQSMSASEISRISMLDQVAVSRALVMLHQDGFVIRQRVRKDKRTLEVSLTKEGWKYYGDLMPVMRAQNEAFAALFSPAELTSLFLAIEKMDHLFEKLNTQRSLYGDAAELGDLSKRQGASSSGRERSLARAGVRKR
jgi:DNA-binding MarR family transcriptional regulator